MSNDKYYEHKEFRSAKECQEYYYAEAAQEKKRNLRSEKEPRAAFVDDSYQINRIEEKNIESMVTEMRIKDGARYYKVANVFVPATHSCFNNVRDKLRDMFMLVLSFVKFHKFGNVLVQWGTDEYKKAPNPTWEFIYHMKRCLGKSSFTEYVLDHKEGVDIYGNHDRLLSSEKVGGSRGPNEVKEAQDSSDDIPLARIVTISTELPACDYCHEIRPKFICCKFPSCPILICNVCYKGTAPNAFCCFYHVDVKSELGTFLSSLPPESLPAKLSPKTQALNNLSDPLLPSLWCGIKLQVSERIALTIFVENSELYSSKYYNHILNVAVSGLALYGVKAVITTSIEDVKNSEAPTVLVLRHSKSNQEEFNIDAQDANEADYHPGDPVPFFSTIITSKTKNIILGTCMKWDKITLKEVNEAIVNYHKVNILSFYVNPLNFLDNCYFYVVLHTALLASCMVNKVSFSYESLTSAFFQSLAMSASSVQYWGNSFKPFLLSYERKLISTPSMLTFFPATPTCYLCNGKMEFKNDQRINLKLLNLYHFRCKDCLQHWNILDRKYDILKFNIQYDPRN
jgi:hypothetical protein